jgi:hypothetical protein
MTEDIADDLGGRAGLDLAGRVSVAECVRAEKISVHPCSVGVQDEAVFEPRRTGQPGVWQAVTDEDGAIARPRGTVMPQVSRESATYGIKQGEQRDDASLRSSDPDRPRRPVDVIESQPGDLTGAHSVGRHHQKDREVPRSQPLVNLDRAEDPLDVHPRQGSRRPIVPTDAGRDHEPDEIGPAPTLGEQEGEECPQCRARCRDRGRRPPPATPFDEGVDICGTDMGNGATASSERSQECRSHLRIEVGAPGRDTSVAEPIGDELTHQGSERLFRRRRLPRRQHAAHSDEREGECAHGRRG